MRHPAPLSHDDGFYMVPDSLIKEGAGKGQEQRRHRRNNYLGTAHYCLNPHSHGGVMIGSGIDVSEAGMSTFSSCPLKKGQGIVVRNRIPVPHQTVTVKWVKELKESWYHEGIEFADLVRNVVRAGLMEV